MKVCIPSNYNINESYGIIVLVGVVHGGGVNCEPVDDAHRVAGLCVEDVQLGNKVVGVVLVP
jgi:hypothetical protein